MSKCILPQLKSHSSDGSNSIDFQKKGFTLAFQKHHNNFIVAMNKKY